MEKNDMKNKWIKKDNGFGEPTYICPVCGKRALEKLVWIDTVEEVPSNFCPNCGINLSGEDEFVSYVKIKDLISMLLNFDMNGKANIYTTGDDNIVINIRNMEDKETD